MIDTSLHLQVDKTIVSHESLFIISGAVLVGNPWYLDWITIYPSNSFTLIPLHSALLTIFGLILLSTGIVRVGGFDKRFPPALFVLTIALLAVFLFILIEAAYVIFADQVTLVDGIRKTVVSGIAASLFAISGSLRARNAQATLIASTLALLFVLIGGFDWRFDPLLGPILDGWFLLTGGPILGINYGGSLMLLAMGLLGAWLGAETN